jgi:hypothetical protein
MQHVARCSDSQMFNSSAGVCRRSMAGPISIARSSPTISAVCDWGIEKTLVYGGDRPEVGRHPPTIYTTCQTGEDEVVFGRVVSLPDGLARAELAVLFRYDVVEKSPILIGEAGELLPFSSPLSFADTPFVIGISLEQAGPRTHTQRGDCAFPRVVQQASGAPIIDASFRNTCTDERRLAASPGLPLASCKSGHIWSIPVAQRLVLAGGRLGLLDKARTSPGEDYSQASRKRRHPEASMLLAEETRY